MPKGIKSTVNVVSYTLGFRLMSMLLIAPFLSVYALELKGGTPALTGLALGVFGLTQAILQIPFGILSDRFGYKRMMIVGVLLLLSGLIVAALTHNVYWLIFSRALQGSGAIVTVGYSWISTITSGDQRDNALVKVGTLIATFSMLSYVLGPLVHIVLSVRYMFLFSAVLMLACLAIVVLVTDEIKSNENAVVTKQQVPDRKISKGHILSSMLLTVNNFIMMAFFYVFPLALKGLLATSQMWTILVPSIIMALLFQKLLARVAIKGNTKLLLYILFALEGVGYLAIANEKLWSIALGTFLLMIGAFSISTIVPLLLNKKNGDSKAQGKSNGIMVSFQYAGSFLGAVVTGILWTFSSLYAFVFIMMMSVVGIVLVARNRYIM